MTTPKEFAAIASGGNEE